MLLSLALEFRRRGRFQGMLREARCKTGQRTLRVEAIENPAGEREQRPGEGVQIGAEKVRAVVREGSIVRMSVQDGPWEGRGSAGPAIPTHTLVIDGCQKK